MIRRVCLLGLLLAATACSTQPPPRLVVVVVVDQMRADALDRFAAQSSGGLARLTQEGTYFDNASFGHAMTGTAPGHATIATGADPRVHGVFEKAWYDKASGMEVRCETDSEARLLAPESPMGLSPRQLKATALGDWLKAAEPRSKVYSVALKPRAALLMGGHDADAAFWFSREHTQFLTSDYYQTELPAWAVKFNRRDTIFQFHGQAWDLLREESAYADSREDVFEGEYDGVRISFPHDFHAEGDDTEAYSDQLFFSPFGDDLTFQFARELTLAEDLGGDAHPDLLYIGCSSSDYVGHFYGPWSQEVNDYFLRLDLYLERGMAWLDENIGRENYVVVFTADHGVAMLPEEARRRNLDAGRVVHQQYADDVSAAFAECQTSLGLTTSPSVHTCHEGVYLDYDAAAAIGLSPTAFESSVRKHLSSIEYVDRVFTRTELALEPDGTDAMLDHFRRTYAPDRAPDVMFLYKPHWVVDTYPGGTDHGTPHPYDRRVPLVMLGRDWPAQRVTEPVDMTDVASTLAALLGVDPADTARGRDLRALVR